MILPLFANAPLNPTTLQPLFKPVRVLVFLVTAMTVCLVQHSGMQFDRGIAGNVFSTDLREACRLVRWHTPVPLSHDNVFHSVPGTLSVGTAIYNPGLDLFHACSRSGVQRARELETETRARVADAR